MANSGTTFTCVLDPSRLTPFAEAMDSYGVTGPDPEWPHNCVARSTIACSCGALARQQLIEFHSHAVDEFQRCQLLSRQVRDLMQDVEVGLGSNATSYFSDYYVAADLARPIQQVIDEPFVRHIFGGSIYPPTKIVIEDMNEESSWWQAVVADCTDDDEGLDETLLAPWRQMMAWFHEHPDLSQPSFVQIGEIPLSQANYGCVFPRLAVALTRGGSLVGLAGCVVHT